MIRVRSLSIESPSRVLIDQALHAACWPFGSLTPRVPDLMLAYIGGMYSVGRCTVEAGTELLRELRAVDGEWSEVLLGAARVQIVTPTSRTAITLSGSPGNWTLLVDFGLGGSDRRADQILEHPGRGRDQRSQGAVVKRARHTSDWERGPGAIFAEIHDPDA